MSVLTDIRTSRHGSRRRTLLLDGEPWRDVPLDVIARAHLDVGQQIDSDVLLEVLAAFEPSSARDRAVRLLTYRERSVSELRERLAEDGYSLGVIDSVVERLREIGLVDDERFARSFARNLTQVRGLGRMRAQRELASRGIDAALTTDALDDALPLEVEARTAAMLARVFAARTGATRDKVAARLARRGYSASIALSAARDAIESAAHDGNEEVWPAPDTDSEDGLDSP